MKQQYRQAVKISILASLMAFIPAIGQQKNGLDATKQAYELKLSGFLVDYGRSLESTLEGLKKKGDLDNYLVVEAEKKRFAQEQSVPVPSKTHKVIASSAQAYYQARVKLLNDYVKALDAIIKRAVIEGRIEDAKAVKIEREKAAQQLPEWEAIAGLTTKQDQPIREEVPPAAPAVNLDKDILLHYTFGGLAKPNIDDQSGKGNEGVGHGGSRGSRGARARAYLFDGKNDYIVSSEKVDVSANMPWSMSLWVKANKKPTAYDNIISLGKSFVPRGVFGLGAGEDGMSFNINLWCGENFMVKADVDYSKAFVHVAAVYDGVKVFVYVNGVLKEDRRVALALVKSPVWMGGRTGGYEGQYFEGSLGDIMIFKRALSEQEVMSLYNNQK